MKRFAVLLGLVSLLVAGCGGSDDSDSDFDVTLTDQQAELVREQVRNSDEAKAHVDEAISAYEQGDAVAALENCTAAMKSVGSVYKTKKELLQTGFSNVRADALSLPASYLDLSCSSLIRQVENAPKGSSGVDEPLDEGVIKYRNEYDERMKKPTVQETLEAT